MKSTFLLVLLSLFSLQGFTQNNPFTDASRSYALPTFAQNSKGEAVIYWTEKDDASKSYLYFSTSADGGKTFSDKQLVFADAGLGGGRLMRPRLLFKKNGEIVAVFAHRGGAAMPPRPQQAPVAQENHAGHGNHKPATPPADGRPKRDGQIKYVSSKDGGKTWTEAMPVDTDSTPLMRGFFDAVVLANDEIAVSYLKDVKGSTKHEERDLRLAITKNGVFQDEKLIDPVVCDCCNIGMLVDTKGALNVFYRDNNDDIRDIAVMTSADNGATFSKSKIVHNDKWEIKGCPHSGAMAVGTSSGYLATWFSGAEDNGGLRIADSDGKLLKVLENGAKNAWLAAEKQNAIWVWEQAGNIYASKVENGKLGEANKIADSDAGQNASALLLNGKTIIAYEIANPQKKTTMVVKVLK